MKQLRIMMAAFVAVALTACVNDDPKGGATNVQGTPGFDIKIKSLSNRVVTDEDLMKCTFEDGDEIGLYVMMRPSNMGSPVYPGDATASALLENVRMTYDEANDVWGFDDPEAVIFRQYGYKYDFYAYYPYDASMTDPADYTFMGGILPTCDFMTARNTTVANDQTVVDLTFEHHTSLIEIRKPGLGSAGVVEINLNGLINEATVNLGTGVVTPGDPVETTDDFSEMAPYTEFSESGKFRIWLPAQTLAPATGGLIQSRASADVTDLSEIGLFSLTEDLVLTAGESRVLNLKSSVSADDMSAANSVVMETGEIETIPVRKAYAMWMFDNNLSSADIDLYGDPELRLLWSDISDFESEATVSFDGTLGMDGEITVGAGVLTSANAVYGLVLNEQVLWSWHIWITPEPISEINYNNGQQSYDFMNYELGAGSTSPGLLYQFGRKDPFPMTGDVVATSDMSTIDLLVSHPTTFAADWNPSYEDGLWDNGGSKSAYDPCPGGWKVPQRVNGRTPWYLASANPQMSMTPYSTTGWQTDRIDFNATGYVLGAYLATNYRDAVTGEAATGVDGVYIWSAQGYGLGVYYDQTANGYVVNTSYLPAAPGAAQAIRCVTE